MKELVEEERKNKREESRKEAESALRDGDEETAMKKFGESFDVTPKIAKMLIRALQMMGIEYYVAPYEADA